jgi:hypothetical protein
MNPDDIKKKLREAGIPIDGKWHEQGARKVKSPILEKQRETMRQLEGLLVKQVEKDKEKMSELQAALIKLKHGGAG